MIQSSLSFVSLKKYGLHLVECSLPLALKYIACGREKTPKVVIFYVRETKNISQTILSLLNLNNLWYNMCLQLYTRILRYQNLITYYWNYQCSNSMQNSLKTVRIK